MMRRLIWLGERLRMDLEGLRRWELLRVERIFTTIQVNSCIIDASYRGDSAMGPASEARSQRFGGRS
jgi:hypothetical protein